jgi:hypothetical protein
LSIEARSLLGVFLDFNGISREKIALAWQRDAKSRLPREVPSAERSLDAGPLFKGGNIDGASSKSKNDKGT